MYAIVETGGKQYRVQPGDAIAVEQLLGDSGATVDLTRVLMIADGAETRVGRPTLDGAVVRAEILDQTRGEKIIVFRFKSKVRYRRKTGHRQHLTRLRIKDVLIGDATAHPEVILSPEESKTAAAVKAGSVAAEVVEES